MYRLRALFGGERRRSCPGQYILGILNGMEWNKRKDEGVLEIDVPSSICSLCFSGFFCFVVFLLVSCFFSLSNYSGLSVTIWRNA